LVVGALLAIIGIGLMTVVGEGRGTPSGRPDCITLGSPFAVGAGLGALEPGSPTPCARTGADQEFDHAKVRLSDRRRGVRPFLDSCEDAPAIDAP
jgi:hypothetical protein